jgi:hypothetical protein
MPAALNNFKTTLANIETTTGNVYTPPIGYSTVVLMAQVSNTSNVTVDVSAGIYRSGNATALINSASIPANDAISVLTGRLILEYGDTLQFSSSANNSAQLVLSYLETLITGS